MSLPTQLSPLGEVTVLPGVPKPTLEEIAALHAQFKEAAEMAIEKAIRIGRLLQEQKKKMKHGKWEEFVANSLPFCSRTARNYMRLAAASSTFKSETISDLGVTKAYAALAAS